MESRREAKEGAPRTTQTESFFISLCLNLKWGCLNIGDLPKQLSSKQVKDGLSVGPNQC